MSCSSKEQQLLIDRFVASFEILADLTVLDTDPIARQLMAGEPDVHGYRQWRPIKVTADRSAIDQIYTGLPARFPPLFELLLLSFRWAEIDLRLYRLIANPPGRDLGGFLEQMSKDPGIWKCLKPVGYMQFGKGPESDYDPVCFDTRSRKKNGDCRIVKIDHEEILCNDRVKVICELAPSFQELMLRTIDQIRP